MGLAEDPEIWREVPGFEGRYEVSSHGRVRSLPRVELSSRGRRVVKGGLLRSTPDPDGYLHVSLSGGSGAKRRTCSLHRLVCTAFHGPPTLLHNEAAHLDGSRTNARADNLRWVSKRENHSHKRLHGTHGAGEKHPRARLTEASARVAISMLADGLTCKEVGAVVGVSASAIEDIRKRKNWRHIQGPTAAYAPRSTGSGQHGAKNHWAKLTQDQAEEIRRRGRAGETCRALGREFGISKAAANRAIRGETYKASMRGKPPDRRFPCSTRVGGGGESGRRSVPAVAPSLPISCEASPPVRNG